MALDQPPPSNGEPPRSTRWTRGRLGALIPAVVLVGLLAYGFLAPAGESPRRAPDFELPLLSGNGTLSSSDLRGDPVVLNFWATWCTPCRAEMPALEAAWQKYRGEGLQIVGVLVQDSDEGADAFVKELGVTYPIVYGHGSELARDLKVFGLPQTFFIDENYEFIGVSRGRALERGAGDRVTLGQISPAELERKIEELLAEDQ